MRKFFALGLLFLLPLKTFAAGIQVTPEKLEFDGNKEQTHEITIANPTADVQIFEVYADDFQRAFLIIPESFTLEAGGRKTVSVTLVPDRLQGHLRTNISIVGKPLAQSKLQVNAGVKIPVTIIAPKASNYWLLVLGMILMLGGLGVIFFTLTKKIKTPQD